MFIVPTYVAPSPIHGLGVYAREAIAAEQLIWQFAPGLDLLVPFERIATAPRAFRDFMEMYAYQSPLLDGGMVLSCDHAKFLNHSETPNTIIDGHYTFARRAIAQSEEITCDYGVCVAHWDGRFEPAI